MSCLYILEFNLFSVTSLANISHILQVVFLFCLCFPLLCKSVYFCFSFIFITLDGRSKHILVLFMSTSRSVIESRLIFLFLIHFKFIFVYTVRKYFIFIPFLLFLFKSICFTVFWVYCKVIQLFSFPDSFPLQVITRQCIQFPVLFSKYSLFT